MAEDSNNVSMSQAMGPVHDEFFAKNFNDSEQVKSLLQLVMTPKQLALYDLDTLTVETNALSSPTSHKARYSDLSARVRLKEGEDVYICIVLEHKSSPDPGVMLQLLRYITGLYEKKAKAVLPIIIYHGQSEWVGEKSFFAFMHDGMPEGFMSENGHKLVNFEAEFVRLGDAEVLSRLPALVNPSRLVIRVMVEIWQADIGSLMRWSEEMRDMQSANLASELFENVVKYFMKVRRGYKIEDVKVEFEVRAKSGDRYMEGKLMELNEMLPLTGEDILQMGKSLGREEGLEEGKLLGREEGREEGKLLGREEGVQRMAYKIAKRFIEDGKSEAEIQRYIDLSPAEIRSLRNGS